MIDGNIAPSVHEGRFVDLHMHSTASDGLLPPEGVVAAAANLRLAAIALTDHDTVAGIPAAQAASDAAGIQLIPGVELSARETERETHVLGLHLQNLPVIEDRLIELREARTRRAVRIVDKLRALGIPITTEAVFASAGTSAVGRPHIARVMVANGWSPSLRHAFDQYLGAGRPAFDAKDPFSLGESIEVIHAAGGMAVVAHPAESGTVDSLTAMKKLGLDGVEVLHPSHSTDDIKRLDAIATHLGLLRSGGSDWHGTDAGKRKLGGQLVPFVWLELQREHVSRLRSAG